MELQLDGRSALVTGSNRGTGSVIAETLEAEGAHVFLHGPGASDGQEEHCRAIAEQGGRAMRERGWGRVIQLATIGVLSPNARMPYYYASKGALASMSVSLCKELAGTGITVNTVSPGLIRTSEVEASFRATAAKRGWGEDWPSIEARVVEAFMPNPCGRMRRRSGLRPHGAQHVRGGGRQWAGPARMKATPSM